VAIPGATSATLALPAALGTDCGATFSAPWFRTAVGRVTSEAATLAVRPAPGAPILLSHPERSRVLTNQTGVFTVSAWSPSPMRYAWQKGTFPNADNFQYVAGANAATYTSPPTALSDHLTMFRCVVSNALGSATSASEMLFVTTAVVSPKEITSEIRVSAQAEASFSYAIRSSGGTAPLGFSAAPLPDGSLA
jgi:hypothetical protein